MTYDFKRFAGQSTQNAGYHNFNWDLVQAILGRYDEYLAAIPIWTKYTYAYSDFRSAALTQTKSLLSLPIGGCVEGIQVFETIQFAGPGLGLCNVTCGDPVAVDSLTPAWDLFAAYDATRIQRPPIDVIYSQAAATALTVTVTADINLNLLTAGAFSVWLKTAKAV